MGFITSHSNSQNYNFSHKTLLNDSYNCRVAMWHIPYNEKYTDYDTDNSKWFESINKDGENEIEKVTKELRINLNRYKTYTRTMEYDDNSVTEISKYPNGNIVKVNKSSDYVFVEIKDKKDRLVAEKFFSASSNEGRKTIYKNYTQGDDTFTIVRVFSYDTTKNKSSDIVNYGYTSLDTKLTDGCTFEKEYYMLNGKEVKAKLNNKSEYQVKNEQGKKLTFKTE